MADGSWTAGSKWKLYQKFRERIWYVAISDCDELLSKYKGFTAPVIDVEVTAM
jgi:hypothetical protein